MFYQRNWTSTTANSLDTLQNSIYHHFILAHCFSVYEENKDCMIYLALQGAETAKEYIFTKKCARRLLKIIDHKMYPKHDHRLVHFLQDKGKSSINDRKATLCQRDKERWIVLAIAMHVCTTRSVCDFCRREPTAHGPPHSTQCSLLSCCLLVWLPSLFRDSMTEWRLEMLQFLRIVFCSATILFAICLVRSFLADRLVLFAFGRMYKWKFRITRLRRPIFSVCRCVILFASSVKKKRLATFILLRFTTANKRFSLINLLTTCLQMCTCIGYLLCVRFYAISCVTWFTKESCHSTTFSH